MKGELMIKRLEVGNLNGEVSVDLEFKPDLNIFTGINGSGKTTLLKLMWYLISGQIDRALYIRFDRVSIYTDRFDLSIFADDQDEFRIDCSFRKPHYEKSLGFAFQDARDECLELNLEIAEMMKSSLFFPSFRRIEGGFSQILPDARSITRARRSRDSIRAQIRELSPLQDAMSQMSANRSNGDHKFVTSYSTTDIVKLLLQKETEISKEINAIHADFLRDLSGKIPSDSMTELEETNSILKQINDNLTKADSEEQKLRDPLTSLNEFIKIIFPQGITITESFTLGNKSNAIPSEWLSSGGKQMLSFLCYNAFSDNTTIFIDEPELSLHKDWQDILLPLLLKQATGNLFFVATHSALIYDQYPNNEFILEELEEN